MYEIPYSEMKYPDLLIDLCHGLYILRNERYKGHMADEIQLYYFLLDIIKSSTTLQRLTWKKPADINDINNNGNDDDDVISRNNIRRRTIILRD